MAELLDGYEFEERVETSMVVKDPIGVVAAIAPWNLPLNQLAAKIAPALAAGCTLVVKPSEVTPLNALVLAEVIDAAGAPDGVVNLVMGTGPTVGQALVGHAHVDMISFTGSTRAGRQIGEVAAATVKRVALELGGKSPAILLEDCDFEQAVPAVVSACYSNSGQSCIALSRMLVPRARLAEAEESAKRAAESFVVGDPFHEETKLGPLVSAAQLTRVRSYIAAGLEEGARLVTGGVDPPFDGSPPGYFVRPTVFSEVKSDMKIAQEEIFGPVLSIMPYDDEADAVSLANDTIFGLAAGVWSTDPEHAQRVARDLWAGQVFLNGTRSSEVLPFGGYKQSGNGREWGKWGLEEYLEIKALHA